MFLAHCCNIFPAWGRSVITLDAVGNYLRGRRVRVIETSPDIMEFGCYTIYRSVEFIVINRQLPPALFMWVLLHETFHREAHVVHHNFSRSTVEKFDYEANCFAAVAMMPRHRIEGKTVEEVAYEMDIPAELVELRKRIADGYGF